MMQRTLNMVLQGLQKDSTACDEQQEAERHTNGLALRSAWEPQQGSIAEGVLRLRGRPSLMTFVFTNMARHVGAGDGPVLGGAFWRPLGLEVVCTMRTWEKLWGGMMV